LHYPAVRQAAPCVRRRIATCRQCPPTPARCTLATPLRQGFRDSECAGAALSPVESVEPEADERRLHKEVILLIIDNRETRF
jgi:hypothetical protein